MTSNRFLQAARAGRNDLWRYIVTLLLTITLTIGGGVCLVLAGMLAAGTMDIFSLPPAPFLALNLVPFFFIVLSLGVCLPLLHKRSLFSLVNPAAGRVHWGRFFFSGGLWLLISGLADFIVSRFQPANYVFSWDLARLLPWMAVALLLIPVQCAAEELLFRGYLSQGFGLAGGIWVAWLVPAVLFGLLHGANPEVGAYGLLWTMPLYIGIGLVLGWVTLRSESLEMALGLHVANNLYASLLVTFPSSALPAPALFQIQRYDPRLSLAVFVIMAVLYVALARWFLKRTQTG